MLNPYYNRKKRGLNPYFSLNGENVDNSNEQKLFKGLQEEMIQIYGYKCTYIVRTNNTLDEIWGESIGTVFKHAFEIEMIAENSDLMQGKDSIMAFGYNMTDTVTMLCSFDRLVEEIRHLGIEGREYPAAGDLVAFNIPGNIMEIRYVEDKVVPFMLGTYSIYALYCQVMDYSGEKFETGDENIDVLNQFNGVYSDPFTDNNKIADESAESVISEPNIWNLELGRGGK